MKRVEAIIRTNRLEEVKESLEQNGLHGITCESVRGYGRQQGQNAVFTGSSYALNLVPKTKIEIVVNDSQVETAIESILEAARTGEMGDGKIFISEVSEAVRISTGERGEIAL